MKLIVSMLFLITPFFADGYKLKSDVIMAQLAKKISAGAEI